MKILYIQNKLRDKSIMSSRNELVSTKTNNTRKRKMVQSTTTSANKRSKRTTKKPDRLGKRISAINRDSFFENILNGTYSGDEQGISNNADESTEFDSRDASQQSENSQSIDDGDELISVGSNEGPQIFEEAIISKLNEILIRISEIEKFQAKSDVRLRSIEKIMGQLNGMEETDGEHIDRSQLGLPCKSKGEMDKLEKDLNENERKKTMVIAHFSCFFLFLFCFFCFFFFDN